MKRAWLFVLPLIASLLWIGAGSSHAADSPTWKITGVANFGCAGGAWDVKYVRSGMSTNDYVSHTVVSSGGKIYMNESITNTGNSDGTWGLYSSNSYGDTTGTYPIPAGQPMKAVFTLEKPLGNVVYSWTMVARGCGGSTLIFNGPTSEDADGDYVPVFSDVCPAITGFRPNGCPLRPRTLTLKPAYGPKRLLVQLTAEYPQLSAVRPVTIWEVRPGPDLKVGTWTTNKAGRVNVRVGAGQYYGVTKALLVRAAGQSPSKRSATVKVK